MRALLAVAVLLFAGCAAPSGAPPGAPGPDAGDAEPVDRVGCAYCYEPTLAALPEGLLVDDWSRGWTLLARNGSVTTLAPPRPDLGPNTFTGEPFLDVAEGVAVYAVLAHDREGFVNKLATGEPAAEIRVFRGFPEPVAVAAFTVGEASGRALPIGDRPWVAAEGPYVLVSWAAPNVGAIEGAWSEDGGRTWSEPRLVYRTSVLGAGSPLPSLSGEGRLLVPFFTGGASLPVGVVEPPARLAVRWSDDGGATWTEGDGPGLLVVDAPASASFWTGSAWGPEVGFVLAWATGAGSLVLSTSEDGATWAAPRVVHEMGGPGVHPWVEPHGRCITLSAWSHDEIADRFALRLVVVRDGETVLEQPIAEVDAQQTDFPQHVVLDGSAVLAWAEGAEHRLARVPLDGLGCGPS